MRSRDARFTGSLPAAYDRHLGPALFEPYAVDLAARLPAGDDVRVLEVACGSGIVTRRLREALPASATLVATDLNEAMVEYARHAVPEPGIEWQQADAQALPFADASFDAVVCQFGLMFLPDKVQGFREARRVLHAGGVLLANVWRPLEANPVPRAVDAALVALWPDDPPRFMHVPHGYGDPGQIRADLGAAGWEDVRLEDVNLEGAVPTAEDVAAGYARGTPLAHQLAERGADVDEVVRAVTAALERLSRERPFRVEHAAIVLTAARH